MYGQLPIYATAPLEALGTPDVTMVGVGITMEAINQNYGTPVCRCFACEVKMGPN